MRVAMVLGLCVSAYLALAYFVLPALWSHYEHQPGLRGRPMTTVTAEGIPGGPLNIGLVGSRDDVVRAWGLAGWYAADPITLKTSLEIAESVLLHRQYMDAPVSNLFYDGRQQDLAFEKPVGGSADQRHHVRLWMTLKNGAEERPVWLGSATFDRGVGISRYTGQITHHIAPNIDAERDLVIAELSRTGVLMQIYQVSGIGPTINGRNGEGDRYFTDGEVTVGVIRPQAKAEGGLPDRKPSPTAIELKNSIWSSISNGLRRLYPGPGIPTDQQTRVFERFHQVDNSNTKKKGGTGLGLAVAKQIVEMHGGRVWVESEPRHGATFQLHLPVRAEKTLQ